MSPKIPTQIVEATHLTIGGNLTEATAVIQRWLGVRDEVAHLNSRSMVPEPANTSSHSALLQSNPTAKCNPGLSSRPRTGLRQALRDLAGLSRPINFEVSGGAAVRPPGPPLPVGASFVRAGFSNHAGARDYKLYIPSSRSAAPRPLIVMLHGCTQSPDDFAAGTRMNSFAEQRGFLVAYPEQAGSANAQRCWNWFKPADQRRGEGEPALIAGITQQIVRNHSVEPNRVYIAGLSAGGAAAAIMGAAYPDVFAAVGVHSGLALGAAYDVGSAFDAMRHGARHIGQTTRIVPTIVFHGDRDTTVHPANSHEIVRQSTGSANDVRVTVEHHGAAGGHAYTRTVHADPSNRTLCEQWMIHGAGHAWAGGSTSGSYTDPKGPDATQEMVRFFFEHRRGQI